MIKKTAVLFVLSIFIANFAVADHCLPGCHSDLLKNNISEQEAAPSHGGCHDEEKKSESEKEDDGCDMSKCWLSAAQENTPVEFIYAVSVELIKTYINFKSSLFTNNEFVFLKPRTVKLIYQRPRPPLVALRILNQSFLI